MDIPPAKRARMGHLNLQELFSSGKGSDVIIACNDREWHLHKLVLSEHCDYLDGLFRNKVMTPSTPVDGKQRVVLDFVGVAADSLDCFFRLLYGMSEIFKGSDQRQWNELLIDLCTCADILCASETFKRWITHTIALPYTWIAFNALTYLFERYTPIPLAMGPLLVRILRVDAMRWLYGWCDCEMGMSIGDMDFALLCGLWLNIYRGTSAVGNLVRIPNSTAEKDRPILAQLGPLFPVILGDNASRDEAGNEGYFNFERATRGTYHRLCFDGTSLFGTTSMRLDFKPPIEGFDIALELTLSVNSISTRADVFLTIKGKVHVGNLPLRVSVCAVSCPLQLPIGDAVDATFCVVTRPEIFDFAPYLQFYIEEDRYQGSVPAQSQ